MLEAPLFCSTIGQLGERARALGNLACRQGQSWGVLGEKTSSLEGAGRLAGTVTRANLHGPETTTRGFGCTRRGIVCVATSGDEPIRGSRGNDDQADDYQKHFVI